MFDRRRGSWNAARGRGRGGGDARPKEEFRRKTYAFAIPRRISLEGSGVVDRWIMLAQETEEEIGGWEGFLRSSRESVPKGETSSLPSL